MKTVTNFLVLIALFASTTVFAQAQDEKEVDLYELSLEELLNIPINSASKKDETLFDAPLSSYTITRADIDKAGSTTIMEALRLAPGVIVREQANGVYDIHIRGLDNILRRSETYTKSNLATLVMIDNRPVFNHNLGGTFWEALPIDLNDIDRIEIVRGPSAPLFGPNAVTGVINIITKRANDEKTVVNASVTGGTQSTMIANALVGKDFGKFNAQVSGNFQKRERFDDKYYFPATDAYYSVAELSAMTGRDLSVQYPDAAKAFDKFGANVMLGFEATERIKFDLSLGTQQSETQKIFLANVFSGGMPFTVNQTETSYANLSASIHNFGLRTSYISGHDNLALEATPNQYDYKVYDVNAEYTFHLGKVGTLVPGINYQNAVYGDEEYASKGLTFLNGTERTITTTSGFLRTDLKPVKNLRVLAAIRADKFSIPDDVYFAYEVAATFSINKSNLVRAAVTRSNSGSFIGHDFLNLQVPNTPAPGLVFVRRGQNDLKLLTVNMIELGYRVQVGKNLQLDLDVFQQTAENFTALTTVGLEAPNHYVQEFANVPVTATQQGATLSINYVFNEKLQVKPFVTVQKTRVEDYQSTYDYTGAGGTVTYSNEDHENTPSVYGGYFINYKPLSKLNINLNGYYFAGHHQTYGDEAADAATGEIAGRFLLNLKVNYAITKQFNVFVNGRNLSNNDKTEFFGADKTGSSFLAGLSFNMN
jgi:iron complex outermembrane receptor protein